MSAIMGETLFLGPAVGLGHDRHTFLDEIPPTLEELLAREMTTGNFDGHAVSEADQMILDYVQLNSAVESSNNYNLSSSLPGGTAAASDLLRSPAEGTVASHRPSNQSTVRAAVESVSGGSSRSPGTTSQILTPASTFQDYNASISDSNFLDEDDTDDNLSPTSDSDYVHVSLSQLQSRGNESGPQNVHMSNNGQQLSSSQGSGCSDRRRLSRASSIAPSTASFPGAQWGNVYTAGAPFMDNQRPQYGSGDHTGFYVPGSYPQSTNAYTSTEQNYGDVLSDLTSVDTHMFDSPLPYRPGHDQQFYAQNIYGSSAFAPTYHQTYVRAYGQSNPAAQPQPHHAHPYGQSGMRDSSVPNQPTPLSIPSTASLLVQPQSNPLTAPPKVEQTRPSPSPMQAAPYVARRSVPTLPSHRHAPYHPQVSRPSQTPHPTTLQIGSQYSPNVQMRQSPSGATGVNRPLQAAKERPPAVPSNVSRPIAPDHSRKGGRQKGARLPESAKIKSSKMRKVVACWRCALQRDPCDPGMPCNRCMMRNQKGQAYFFDCDRSKLPDFVHDFLPATMTLMHQKQTIEDTVAYEVLEWDTEHPITVYLTSGYGPPLRWTLHEFKARTNDLLGQFQYLQDPATGLQKRFHKYSPPFGLLKLDSTDDTYLQNYVESLLTPDYLWEFGWTVFEEESEVDGQHFQAQLLQLLCILYEKTDDTDLKNILHEILRMMVITYIMSHTLTIVEETLPSVLDAIKHSPKGPKQQFTSPRLANRQLKFYFSVFRANIYEKILKWQQQTLHTSGKKEDTWLLSFCAMIGFAMVLEEVQRIIIIQADAKATKHEMPWEQAHTEARNACERIDARYKLLVGLFQCKYRDKKWGEGSFGNSTPKFSDDAVNEFLADVRELLETRTAHLQSRRDIPFAVDTQCQYTSRLVARFLLPFLTLPP